MNGIFTVLIALRLMQPAPDIDDRREQNSRYIGNGWGPEPLPDPYTEEKKAAVPARARHLAGPPQQPDVPRTRRGRPQGEAMTSTQYDPDAPKTAEELELEGIIYRLAHQLREAQEGSAVNYW